MQQIKEQKYLSIVVVVVKQNSADIVKFLDTLKQFCEQKFTNYEFIIVANNAPQNIINQVIDQLTNSEIHANLVNLPYEVNKEQAVIAGVDATIGDYVFEFEDTDVDYSTDDLWNMYKTCVVANDIVFLKPNYKISFIEQIFYKLLTKYSNKSPVLFPSRVHLISRRTINRVHNINKVICYRKYAYCNSGLAHAFVEYKSSRPTKRRTLNWQQIDFATDLLIAFTNIGKRISILLSLLFALLSFLAIVYTVITYATVNVVHGWTTLMLFLSSSFAGVFLCFTIVIKYLNLLLLNQQQDKTLIATKQKI